MDSNGLLRFVGRADYQIKLRGQRIETGEIENVLLNFSPEIVNVCVVKFNDKLKGDLLHAFILNQSDSVSGDSGHGEDVMKRDLIGFCQSNLPLYMVPTAWSFVSSFPVNANGKVDRKVLQQIAPVEAIRSPKSGGCSIARTDLEESLRLIFVECFRLADATGIDLTASFGELGGTSLGAVRAVNLIREKVYSGMNIGLLFSFPSVRLLSEVIEPMIKDERFQEVNRVQSQSQLAVPDVASEVKPSILLETLGIIMLLFYYLLPVWTTSFFLRALEINNVWIYTGFHILLIPPKQLLMYIILKRLLFPNGMRAGKYELYSGDYYRWWFLNRVWTLNSSHLKVFLGTQFYNMYLELCGARVSRKDVHIYTTHIDVPDLLEIQKASVVSQDVILNSLSYNLATYELHYIRIGSNCTIGNYAVLYNGVQTQNNVIINPMTSIARFNRFLQPPSNLLSIGSGMTAFDEVLLIPDRVVSGRCVTEKIIIGNNAQMGNQCLIYGGSTIPPYSVVGSMTCVTRDDGIFEPKDIILGVPARKMPFYMSPASTTVDGISKTKTSLTCSYWQKLTAELLAKSIIVFCALVIKSLNINTCFSCLLLLIVYSALLCLLMNSLQEKPQAGPQPMAETLGWHQSILQILPRDYILFISPLLDGTQWIIYVLRGLGAKIIGDDVLISNFTSLTDYTFLTIFNHVRISPRAHIQCHTHEQRILKMVPTTVGPNSILRSISMLFPGCRLEGNNIINPCTLILKDDHLPEHTEWLGCPPKMIVSYNREVKVLSQKRDSATYSVKLTLKNSKQKSVKYEYKEIISAVKFTVVPKGDNSSKIKILSEGFKIDEDDELQESGQERIFEYEVQLEYRDPTKDYES
ncbi:unnamed protein product [Didymodactylos carnosus]|uniref:Carrier domain-containing protein n=1 Tax=Didymodactylos carnosus TaxID=1234261 RepID=A0A815CV85_9BILA|nr:unnamed protein product [Didymodactylos carnosus]CAF4090929.1 unnamed protein product [Didymodactylos carnosus]